MDSNSDQHQPTATYKLRTSRIRDLNDRFRRTFIGGTVMITPGVDNLAPPLRAHLIRQIHQYRDFEASGDPYGEHDFGTIELHGVRFFWKIDYYNRELDGGSEDPSDPAKTNRVLTVRLASEY